MNAEIRDKAKSFRPPGAPNSHRWGDLHNLLDEASSRRLIIINGPPGAGKSTLLASYVASRLLPSIWYPVDNSDNDLTMFLHHFGLAAQAAMPCHKAVIPNLRAGLQGTNGFAKAYFQQIYRHLPTPFLIVLDDYQEIADAAAVHDVLHTACMELPPGGRIAVISRTGCPPALAALNARNMAAIIGPDDLQAD